MPFKTAMRASYIGERGRDLEQKFALRTREAEYNYVARTGQAPPSNRDLQSTMLFQSQCDRKCDRKKKRSSLNTSLGSPSAWGACLRALQ